MNTNGSHIRHAVLKNFIRNLFSKFGLNLSYALTPGISALGLNIFPDKRSGPLRFRSDYAMDVALQLKPHTVLDVGSGGGVHARRFSSHGSDVVCVDYGTSVYAESANDANLKIVNIDFNIYEPKQAFDLVWASHVLEHQRNVGIFIERLIANCAEDGTVCITVPDPHRFLWGGHVTLWTPGLLAYNIVLCGVDLSEAFFVRGSGEFSIFFKPKKALLPDDLTFDFGDLNKLSHLLPQQWRENADPWRLRYM